MIKYFLEGEKLGLGFRVIPNELSSALHRKKDTNHILQCKIYAFQV